MKWSKLNQICSFCFKKSKNKALLTTKELLWVFIFTPIFSVGIEFFEQSKIINAFIEQYKILKIHFVILISLFSFIISIIITFVCFGISTKERFSSFIQVKKKKIYFGTMMLSALVLTLSVLHLYYTKKSLLYYTLNLLLLLWTITIFCLEYNNTKIRYEYRWGQSGNGSNQSGDDSLIDKEDIKADSES